MINNKDDDLHTLIESYRIFASDRDNITYDYQGNDQKFLGTDDQYIRDKVTLFDKNAAGKYNFPNPHGGGTAYMNAVDENGLGVSLIQSNFYGIGSRIGVGSYGFFLHNRGCGFNLIKGHPNSLGPNKKPLHTLSPTIWSKDGSLDFITGTRGGRYQPQLLAQTILPYILGESSFEEIMEKPRWTIEYFGSNTSSNIKFEFLNEPEISRLKEKGHEITVENKLIGGYGPISTIYKNSDKNFIGVPDIRVGTEKAFNNS
jgi:gamma-glutamyltranspeptidase/glutathione hydrolase